MAIKNPFKKNKGSKEKGTANWWLSEIEMARRVKEAWMQKFNVSLGYDYFDGNQRPESWPAEFWITINIYKIEILNTNMVSQSSHPNNKLRCYPILFKLELFIS